MINLSRIPQNAMEVLITLQQKEYASFFVGGSVRDLLLGRIPKDFDICTKATPDQVKAIFPKVVNTGLRFGTVTVLHGKEAIEVTSFSNSFEENVKERDFTINAILFDGKKIIDLVDGIEDLRNNIIRTNGDPDVRFQEDALRMIRGIRLRCQLGFQIEEDTYLSIIRNANLIQGVAWERIRDEFIKILLCKAPSEGFGLLLHTGLLKYILPELVRCHKFDQRNPHHNKDVFDHIMSVVDYIPTNLILRLSALLHDIGKPQTFSIDEKGIGHFYGHSIKGQDMCEEILSRLKFDRKTIRTVKKLVSEHMSRIVVLRSSTIKKLINRVGVENIFRLIDLQIADLAGTAPPHDFKLLEDFKKEVERIINTREPFSLKELAIGGRKLQEIGFQPGPEIGQVLNVLLKLIMNNPNLNNEFTLMKLAEKLYRK